MRRITEIDATGTRILADTRLALTHRNQHLALALAENSELATRLSEAGVIDAIGTDHMFADVDRAIEWAEDDILRHEDEATEAGELSLAAVDLCAGLTDAEIDRLERSIRRTSTRAGAVIFRQGDPGKELYIVARGRASARLAQPGGGDIRLATFAPGTVFGELAILDAGPRSALVVADDDVQCYVLSQANFAELERDAPSIAITLLKNLGRELSGRLRRANRTIHQLES